MKILYLTNVPSPYRVAYFNKLGESCDLTVIFERGYSSERDKSWLTFSADTFRYDIMNGINFGVDCALCFDVFKYLSPDYDHIVVTNFSDPTGILAILYMKLRHICYEIESDGGFPSKTVSFFKKTIKKCLFKDASLFFSTSTVHDEYYYQYGASSQKVVRYPFTSIFENDLIDSIVSDNEKINIRKKLNIAEKNVVISVGRFNYENGYGKGFDLLLKIAEIKREIEFYIIGDNPTQEFIDLKNDFQLDNVHYIPFLNKETLKEYYKAADLMVLLTRGDVWGLVVNEALSNGVPVVTTDRCIAGLELIDTSNGLIVPANSIVETLAFIDRFFSDSLFRQNLAEGALNKARDYTMEKMVSSHFAIWNHK